MKIQVEPQLGRLSQDNQVIAQNLLVWVTEPGDLPEDQGFSLKGLIQLPSNPISMGKYSLELFNPDANRYDRAEGIIIDGIDEKMVKGNSHLVGAFILSDEL